MSVNASRLLPKTSWLDERATTALRKATAKALPSSSERTKNADPDERVWTSNGKRPVWNGTPHQGNWTNADKDKNRAAVTHIAPNRKRGRSPPQNVHQGT